MPSESWKEGLTSGVLNKIRDLETNVERLGKEVKQKQFNFESVEMEKASLQLKVNDYCAQLKKSEGEARASSSKLAQLEQTHDQLKRDLSAKEAQRSCLNDRFDATNEKNKKLGKEITKFEHTIDDLQTKLAKSTCEINNLRDSGEKLRQEKKDGTQTLQEMMMKFEVAEKDVLKWKSDTESSRVQLKDVQKKAKSDIDEATSALAKETERCRGLERELEQRVSSSVDTAKLHEQITTKDNELKALVSALDMARRDAEGTQQAHLQQAQTIETLQSECKTMTDASESVRREHQEALLKVEQEKAVMAATIEKMEKERALKEAEKPDRDAVSQQALKLDAATAELEVFRKKCSDISLELLRAQSALQAAEETRNTQQTALEQRSAVIAALEAELKAATDKQVQLDAADAVRQEGEAKKISADAEKALAGMRTERDAAMERLDTSQREMIQVEQQLAVLSAAVANTEVISHQLRDSMVAATEAEAVATKLLDAELVKTKALQERVANSETDVDSLKECLEGEAAECERLQTQLKQSRVELDCRSSVHLETSQGESKDYQKKLEALLSDRDSRIDTDSQLEHQSTVARKEAATYKEQLDTLTAKYEQQELRYLALITTAKNMERANGVLKAKLSAMKKKSRADPIQTGSQTSDKTQETPDRNQENRGSSASNQSNQDRSRRTKEGGGYIHGKQSW
ncbi:hypothetical protein SARC_09928 [Sphaeroforma arctica JP610]|uniref:Centromere protein Cenp-F N-terminal domain-containing protein n=1 Tax=Sphaeroforma arctica JP610 TaxID=667725 RepID=A0A0L0FNQ6_9EUKA|nr:hypothetical protein SARC_09928 [Sphaeroforma arctica JP610]KNC77613.1 hypothetical protein SARC_09928 [Sphaeroforma arctica JP610]|eukprot:XP_014151515.1 hypothetical protein SARC_09928 [Sphaeroforma arctica JP610]